MNPDDFIDFTRFGDFSDFFRELFSRQFELMRKIHPRQLPVFQAQKIAINIERMFSEFQNSGKSFEDFLKDMIRSSNNLNFANDLLKWAIIAANVFGLAKLVGVGNASSSSAAGSSVISDIASDVSDEVIDSTSKSSQDSDSSSFWDSLKSFFGDSATPFANVLAGFSGQFANSLFNYENQMKLIKYQNEYNTPANQMQRFKDAGLNPNLVYGLGSNGNQPSSGSIAPVDFDTSQRENRMAAMQIALQSKATAADIAQKQAQTRLLDTETEGASEDVISKRFANSTFVEQYQTNLANTIAQTNKYISDLQVNLATIKEKLANTKESSARMTLIQAQTKTENDLREARLDLTHAQAEQARFQSHSRIGGIINDFVTQPFKLTKYATDLYNQYKLNKSTRDYGNMHVIGSSF